MYEVTEMPSTTVYNMAGEAVDQLELSEQVFGVTPNMAVLHQVVTAQLVNRRQGNASTKTRSEVSGGNKKPYRQKGTGRARQGSTRAPQFRGGVPLATIHQLGRYNLMENRHIGGNSEHLLAQFELIYGLTGHVIQIGRASCR